MKKIILLISLTVAGIFLTSNAVLADGVILSAVPASLSATVGTTINSSIQLNPSGNQVCVVQGTVNFNNLTCQSITITSGLINVATPTCANPKFIVGIPKCTTTTQNIISLSFFGTKIGPANFSITGANVLGSGKYLGFAIQNDNYTITAVKQTQPTTNGNGSNSNNVTPPTSGDQENTTPSTTPTVEEQQNGNGNEINSAAPASLLSSIIKMISGWLLGNWFWVLIIIILIIIIIYFFPKRKKEEENNQENNQNNQ